jgi:hypothetical protein
MDFNEIKFSGHAIRQMFQRDLKRDDVLAVIQGGEIIIEYPDDTPYPSCLLLGYVNEIPIHVVLATDCTRQIGIVITAYIPDENLWINGFRTRR